MSDLPGSELTDIANRFRRMLLQEERAAASAMVRAYNDIWQEIRGELRDITEMIEAARAAGVEISESWLLERGRLQTLETQVVQEVTQWSARAGEDITQLQAIAVDLADRQLQATIGATEIGVVLNRLPEQQIAQLIGFLADGSPLTTLLAGLGVEAGERARDVLIKGVALGWNPREMEREMRDGQGKVLSRMLRIMRTEAMRPYREYAHLNYLANRHVVQGWYWLAALQRRTCASCWAMHGTLHRLEERLDDHPNGRCTPVPAVIGYDFRLQKGADVFAALPAEEQQAVLGGAKYEAYRDGRIGLGDLVHRSTSAAWGSVRREASLKEAIGD